MPSDPDEYSEPDDPDEPDEYSEPDELTVTSGESSGDQFDPVVHD